METRSFHYTKIPAIIFVLAYVIVALGFSFALSLSGGTGYKVAMSSAVIFCIFVLFYLVKKWLIPAFHNEELLVIDENALILKNKEATILWPEIAVIELKAGNKYGGAIGIRLKDINAFISKQPTYKSGKSLKFNKWLNGYHFSISTYIIKENNVNNILNEYLSKFGSNE